MNRNRFLVAVPMRWVAACVYAGLVTAAVASPAQAQAQGSAGFAAKQRVAAPGVGLEGARATAAPAVAAAPTQRGTRSASATGTADSALAADSHPGSPARGQRFAAKQQVASDADIERARHALARQQRVTVVVSSHPARAPASAAPAASSPMQAERMGLRVPDDPLELDSGVALLVDANTGEILLGKNDTVVLPIASITKLMTAIVVVDAGQDLNQRLQITSDDIDRLRGSSSRLPVGAELTRGQALHLALMSSENRAAHALARYFPGGVPAFVRQMNRKAAELGMHDTRFADPTGLSGGNRSSARDLAMLTAASSHRPLIRELSISPEYQLALGERVLTYRNSNMLVRNGGWDINLQKTGFIREAGRTLVLQADVSGRPLIMVLLGASGSQSRAADAERLLRWVMVQFFSAGPRPAGAQSASGGAQQRQPG